MSESQKEKERERSRRYYANHKAQVLKARQEYQQEHREEISKRKKHRYETDPDHREQKKHHDSVTKLAKRTEAKIYINEYKTTHPCTQCGEPDADCLQFHHLRDKQFRIASYGAGNHSIEQLKAEIGKCIILCANCHMKLHKRLQREAGGGSWSIPSVRQPAA